MATVEFDYPDGRSPEIRMLVDEEVWSPLSTFGALLTARHEYETFETLQQWGYWSKRPDPAQDLAMARDRHLVGAARRWHGTPLTPPPSGRFVPGDVAAIRVAVTRDDIGRRAMNRLERMDAGRKLGASEQTGVALDSIAAHWLYRAVPYYVELHTLVGLVDCELPSADDLADLVLPSEAVAVYFGGDIMIPLEITETDTALQQLSRRHDSAYLDHPDWISGDEAPPSTITNPQVAIRHRHPVRVCGVVLHADANGRLDDLVMWLTAVPDHVDAPRSIIYGRLASSMLRYVAVNLAAAVSWGQWTSPTLGLNLGDDPTAGEFREAIKTGRFRRVEPFGGAVGVRILDAKRTIRRNTLEADGTHASPVTHLRRRHWQRYRVGPREDWHYERRLLDPVIVNPANTKPQAPLTIYRLPPT